MLAIIEAAGWPIWPILFASVIAVTFIIYCLFNLRKSAVAPKELLPRVVQEYRQGGVNKQMLAKLTANSPLGRIFAAGLKNVSSKREVMKESIEEAGRAAAHDLERFVPAIGTIASMGPLLGLLGTVIGMIEIFGSQAPTGSSPAQLAHGISIALYNTAFGLIVAIPSMFFYRYFRTKIDSLVIDMEMQAIKLVEIVHGEREA